MTFFYPFAIDEWETEYVKYGEWLARPRSFEIFKNEKLFIRQASDYPVATYDMSGKIADQTVYCVYRINDNTDLSLKYVLGLINSKLIKWIFQHDNFQMIGKC